MAKLHSSIMTGNFSVDSVTVYSRGGTVVVRSRRNSQRRVAGTVEQLRRRTTFRNQINLWRAFPSWCRPAFEGRRPGVSDYNMFVSHNMQSGSVYLTRREAGNGACVLTQVAVSDGSLPPITVSHDGVAPVTDLSVGGLTVGSATTVGELSRAIVRNNCGYCFGDELVYYLGLQQWNRMLDMPVVEMRCTRMTLCSVDYRTVAAATVGAAGFVSRDGWLAASAEVQGGMAWVHVRRSDRGVLLSAQRMVCNNPYIAQYSSDESLEAACRSYGVALERPFLEPDGAAVRNCGK